VGQNISTFAPGRNVQLMGKNGQKVINSGTSFSAPYIAGIFAVACSAYPKITTYHTTMSRTILSSLTIDIPKD
jgi:subtilisin family serine protease